MKEWIIKWKEELEKLEHPDNHTPRYCGDDVLELIAEIGRLENGNRQSGKNVEHWKRKAFDLEIKQMPKLTAIMKAAREVDFARLIQCLTSSHSFATIEEIKAIKQLQQLLAAHEKEKDGKQ